MNDKMKKLAHGPVQTWKGWIPVTYLEFPVIENLGFSTPGGFKTLIGTMILIFRACLISPCLIPPYLGLYQDDAL
jgi:hypothetical protein